MCPRLSRKQPGGAIRPLAWREGLGGSKNRPNLVEFCEQFDSRALLHTIGPALSQGALLQSTSIGGAAFNGGPLLPR
jgi:hypothetical protein